jgi:urea carboxylase
MRHDFVRGRYQLKVEQSTFKLADYQSFLAENSESIEGFRAQQQQAFQEERQRWDDADEILEEEVVVEEEAAPAPPGTVPIESPIAGNMWKVTVEEGDTVTTEQGVAILESMKMEMSVESPFDGVVVKLVTAPGSSVQPGQAILYLKTT